MILSGWGDRRDLHPLTPRSQRGASTTSASATSCGCCHPCSGRRTRTPMTGTKTQRPAIERSPTDWGERRELNPRLRGHNPVSVPLDHAHHGTERRTRTPTYAFRVRRDCLLHHLGMLVISVVKELGRGQGTRTPMMSCSQSRRLTISPTLVGRSARTLPLD